MTKKEHLTLGSCLIFQLVNPRHDKPSVFTCIPSAPYLSNVLGIASKRVALTDCQCPICTRNPNCAMAPLRMRRTNCVLFILLYGRRRPWNVPDSFAHALKLLKYSEIIKIIIMKLTSACTQGQIHMTNYANSVATIASQQKS